MSTDTSKNIELVANIAIVVVALLFVTAFIKNYVLTGDTVDTNSIALRDGLGRPPVKESLIRSGARLPASSISEIRPASSDRTLILALSNTCHFCTESAPFYKRLAEMRTGARLVAVLPQSVKEGERYLAKLGVSVDEVTQLNLDKIGVQGTPTIVLIDNVGIVKQSWVGKLSPDGERAVLNALQER